MRRTRKWEYVQQEAKRLAALGLKPADIAVRLEVNRSTVTRWMASGKLTGKPGMAPDAPRVMQASQQQTPAQWAESVRASYDLDVTDEQLVSQGEECLLITRDPMAPAGLRLQAMGRFQAIVKQLSLVARQAAADAKPEAPKRKTFEQPRRTGTDPRGILTGL